MKHRLVVLGVALLFAAACAGGGGSTIAGSSPSASAAVRADLAPTGQLRLGFPAQPPFLGQKDPSSGQWKGLAIAIGEALAKSLGVPLSPTQFAGPPLAYQALQSGQVDVAFAQVQLKPGGVSSTGVIVSVQHSFLVRASATLSTVADIDRDGIKVGSNAMEGHTPILAAQLKHAKLVQFTTTGAGVAALAAGQIDAWADGRAALEGVSAQIPGSRVLDGSFFTPMFAFEAQASHTDGVAYLDSFAATQLSSGAIKQDIDTIVGKPGVLAGAAA